MTPPARDPVGLEGMLDNSGWLRSVALELLNDPSQADDVLQEVWMTAIRRPPCSEEPRSRRSWLKKVCRTFALRANRSARRRNRWEQQTPPKGAAPTPDEMIDRLEMQSRLAEGIRQLPEPYRSVVFLRFYEDASPGDIATLRQVPRSTVRTQLQRGLTMLRERFDRDFREDRRDWRALVLLIANGGGATVSWPTESSPRVSEVGLSSRLALGAGVAVIALVALATVIPLTTWGLAGTNSPLHDGSNVSTTGPDRVVRPRDPELPPRPNVDRRPNAKVEGIATSDSTERDTTVPGLATAVTTPVPSWPISIVDDHTDEAIAGATLYLIGVDEVEAERIGATDPDGRLEIPIAPFCRESIQIFAPGYVEYREPARLRTLGDGPYVLRLTPSRAATVTVRTPDGQPAAGVRVQLEADHALPPAELARWGAREEEQITDENGSVTYAARFQRTIITIEHEPWAMVRTPLLDRVGTITLEPGHLRRGRLVDAGGEPITDSRVEIRSNRLRRAPGFATTDGEGWFELGRVALDDVLSFRVYPTDRPAIALSASPPDSVEWTLEVPNGFTLSGTIADRDGHPISDAVPFLVRRERAAARRSETIPAVNAKRSRSSARADYRLVPYCRGECREDGTFDVGPIATTDDLYLLIHHPRLVNRVFAVDDESTRPVALVLDEGVDVVGRVHSPNGEPMPGVLLHFGERYSNDTESVLGRTRTDADGRFRFVGSPRHQHDRLPGATTETGQPVHREAMFVTAFHPDELLAKDGIPLWDSPVSGSAVYAPGEVDIDLAAASVPHRVEFALELFTADGHGNLGWTPTSLVGRNRVIHRGVLARAGQNSDSGLRFHTDHSLTGSDTRGGVALLRPEGHRWIIVSLADSGDLQTPRRRLDPPLLGHTIGVRDARGPLADRCVAIGLGPAESPLAVAAIGRTDARGRLPSDLVGKAPSGRLRLYVAVHPTTALPHGEVDAFDPDGWLPTRPIDLSQLAADAWVDVAAER